MSTRQVQRKPGGRAKPNNRHEVRRGHPPKGAHTSPTTEWKPGQSGNPNGAPRKGQSIAETIRTISASTPREIRKLLKRLGSTGRSGLEQSLSTLPQDTPLRFLQHTSAFVATICDPNASINSYLRDSDEGKPIERLAGADGGPLEVVFREAPMNLTGSNGNGNGNRNPTS